MSRKRHTWPTPISGYPPHPHYSHIARPSHRLKVNVEYDLSSPARNPDWKRQPPMCVNPGHLRAMLDNMIVTVGDILVILYCIVLSENGMMSAMVSMA